MLIYQKVEGAANARGRIGLAPIDAVVFCSRFEFCSPRDICLTCSPSTEVI
jgi:hypothetical protein